MDYCYGICPTPERRRRAWLEIKLELRVETVIFQFSILLPPSFSLIQENPLATNLTEPFRLTCNRHWSVETKGKSLAPR